MNSVNIIGNITKEPELKKIGDDKTVCGFCVAVAAGKDKADFIDCVAWGDRAENIAKYFHKGDKIGISGQLKTRMYEYEGQNRKTTEVLVQSFDFCNGRKTEQADGSGGMPFEI